MKSIIRNGLALALVLAGYVGARADEAGIAEPKQPSKIAAPRRWRMPSKQPANIHITMPKALFVTENDDDFQPEERPIWRRRNS